MGNCWGAFQDWLFPNPWSGMVIESVEPYMALLRTGSSTQWSLGADLSMRLDEKNGWQIVDIAGQPAKSQPHKPITPSLTAYREPIPSKETDPLLGVVVKTTPEPYMALLSGGSQTLLSPLLQQQPYQHTIIEMKTPTSTKPSPLLIGRAAVPPPTALSLLVIAKQKPITIEH